jgi:hypothetical protein
LKLRVTDTILPEYNYIIINNDGEGMIELLFVHIKRNDSSRLFDNVWKIKMTS